ncbi:hypothetical protein WDU94_002161 [Cyamophila willieti]
MRMKSSKEKSMSQATTPDLTAMTCAKIFIQRDYTDGTMVRFQTHFPQELEGKIERQVYEYTINQMNVYFQEAESVSCKSYCEGCMACLTAYFVYLCAETHYEKCLKKVAKFIAEQNENVFLPRALMLVNPAERGLRVIEIAILDQPIVPRN